MQPLPPLRALQIFAAVGRCGSIVAAAGELGISAGAVSQQIKSLESALGRQLFHRRARGLELTDIGRGYLPTVQAAGIAALDDDLPQRRDALAVSETRVWHGGVCLSLASTSPRTVVDGVSEVV